MGGGGYGSDDDKDWTEDEAGGQGGSRASSGEKKGADGSKGEDGADQNVLSKDFPPSPVYDYIDPCCPQRFIILIWPTDI